MPTRHTTHPADTANNTNYDANTANNNTTLNADTANYNTTYIADTKIKYLLSATAKMDLP